MGAIRLRAGNRAAMPPLADRELVFVRDEQALYVGTAAGALRLCSTLPAADAPSPLAPDAAPADMAAAYNALLDALTAAGVLGDTSQKGEDP